MRGVSVTITIVRLLMLRRSRKTQLAMIGTMARDTMGELVALIGGQVVPAREVWAREFGGELGAGFVRFNRAKECFVVGDAVGAAEVLEHTDFLDAAGWQVGGEVA